MPVSGGTGAAHLVGLLDYQLIRRNPKLFGAFSAPSVLTNSVLAAAGLPSVFGASGFEFFGWPDVDAPTEAAFWRMVSGRVAGLEVTGRDWRVYRASAAAVSGPVVGGNLWAVLALAGTRWMPPTEGAVLLLKDFTAGFDDVDRRLTHLRLAGLFDGIAALVIGDPADWGRRIRPGRQQRRTGAALRRGRFQSSPASASATSSARSSSRPAAGVEFDLRGQHPVLHYREDLVLPGRGHRPPRSGRPRDRLSRPAGS